LRSLFRQILDPAVENIQYAKQQRERIYNDAIYFISSKPPENAPSWTFDEVEYDTDVTFKYQEEEDEDYCTKNYSEKDHFILEYDDYQVEEEEDESDFVSNSAELNALRPEDLDEQGESSTIAANKVS
jgi:hypothetical protein